jgi:HSP20 family molecular chaperone IbpA
MSSGDPVARMWAEAWGLLDRAERLRRHFFELGGPGGRHPSWQAPVDVLETADELVIVVALPGVDTERIEVVVDGDTLLVRGHRPLPTGRKTSRIHRLEIPWGEFVRRIELPPGVHTRPEHHLIDGCLHLVFAKVNGGAR